MDREIQPFSNFQAISVPPSHPTTFRLSGGKTIPYIYQLGVNSSVPYVRLLGSDIGQKLFSWNEKIIVPPQQMVTVENASFHVGDIHINSGWDPSALPARVTVPVNFDEVTGPDGYLTRFPCDTRRARRAFLQGPEATTVNPGEAEVTGRAVGRGHVVGLPAFTELGRPVPEYVSTLTYPPATTLGLIPLGQNALPGDSVHALLDTATVFIADGTPPTTRSGSWYYVIEYL